MEQPAAATSSAWVDEVCRSALALAMRVDAGGATDLIAGALRTPGRTDADVVPLVSTLLTVSHWTGERDRALEVVGPLLTEPLSATTRGKVLTDMALLIPREKEIRGREGLAELTIAGDDQGRASAMLGLAFPSVTLLPGLDHRLRLCDAAESLGRQLGDEAIVQRSAAVRGAVLAYAGRIDEATDSLRSVWDRADVENPSMVTWCGNALLNHALVLLGLGEYDQAAAMADVAEIRFLGSRHRGLLQATRAAALIHRCRHRAALEILDSISGCAEELTSLVTLLRSAATVEVGRYVPRDDLTEEVEAQEQVSMLTGWLGRVVQADLRAARREPRPHRDLGPALRQLAPSRPVLGWDGLALALARHAPEEAAETLADMWDFWPVGERAAIQRDFTETLLGRHDPYPAYLDIARRYAQRGEVLPAAEAMRRASRVAPSGSDSLTAHRSAIELLSGTDADRTLASLLRERRVRRAPGTATIPDSQRYSVNGGLTPRESEVAQRAAQGLTSKEIAAELGISVGTARNHLQRLRDKLGIRSKRELARWAAAR